MLQYFVCTLLLQILQVLIALQIKDHNNQIYWFMGVAHSGCGYIERLHHWVKPGRSVPAAVSEGGLYFLRLPSPSRLGVHKVGMVTTRAENESTKQHIKLDSYC